MTSNQIERLQKLEEYPETKEAKIERGREFEKLINDVFEQEGSLINPSYYTSDNRAEQIDGAIRVSGRVLLLEIKWVETSLAASTLYEFIGKVENKLDGTLGLFVSRENLGNNFLNSIIKGRRRRVLVVHGDDIDCLAQNKISFSKYLAFALEVYSYDNTIHVPVEKYIQELKSSDYTESIGNKSSTKIDKEKVKRVIETALDKKKGEIDIDLALDDIKNEAGKIFIFKHLIQRYEEFHSRFSTSIWDRRMESVDYLIQTLIDSVKDKSRLAKIYLETFLKKKYPYFLKEYFFEAFYSKIVNSSNFDEFLTTLKEVLEEWTGDFNVENLVTFWIEQSWSEISSDLKRQLYKLYLRFYVDGMRQSKFPQKRFAIILFETKQEIDIDKIIDEWLNKKIVEDIEEYKETEKLDDNTHYIEMATKYISRNYKKLRIPLEISEGDFKKRVRSMYQSALKQIHEGN